MSSQEDGVKNTTTTAPTNANTHAKLRDIDLNENLSFVSLVIQHHNLDDEMLTPQKAQELYGIDPEDFIRYMKLDEVTGALKEAGVLREYQAPEIIYVKVDDDWRDNVLTPLQLKVANAVLNAEDTRSRKKKLQDLGVSVDRYQNWLRDPVFNAYLQKRAEAMFGEMGHEAHLALFDKVRMGDTNAIKLYYELTGRYQPGGKTNDNQAQDFQQMLVSILEIISDEIEDPMVGARIADRFQQLIGARTIAQQLTNSITEPEIAGMRPLSPKLKELL